MVSSCDLLRTFEGFQLSQEVFEIKFNMQCALSMMVSLKMRVFQPVVSDLILIWMRWRYTLRTLYIEFVAPWTRRTTDFHYVFHLSWLSLHELNMNVFLIPWEPFEPNLRFVEKSNNMKNQCPWICPYQICGELDLEYCWLEFHELF